MRTLISQRRRRRPKTQRGQSLAEFALVLPVLLLVIGGIIQFGIIFWGQNTLNQVVRDTGRWAATQTQCDTGAAQSAITATANDIAAQSSLIGYNSGTGFGGAVTSSWDVVVGPDCLPDNNQDEAWVNITIDHTVPVFFPWIPGDGDLSSSTQFRMEPQP
jgi:Flp pilus assembly protein TadG